MNRIDNYERMYLGENLKMPHEASRIDLLWQAILNKETVPFEPITRIEKYLAKMIDSSIEVPMPTTRLEEILCAICCGEKVDEETKNACRDEYLKYIYELTSGENMFVPCVTSKDAGATYKGRVITLDGALTIGWYIQRWTHLPLSSGEKVTLRYKYKSGVIEGAEGTVLRIAPFDAATSNWWTSDKIELTSENYTNDAVVVATLENVPTSMYIYPMVKADVFRDFKFEISFEKGDTTQ